MISIGMAVKPPRQQSLLQQALSAIRRLGGTALYVPDDYGLVLGPELGPGTASTTGWTANSSTLTIDAGRLKCTTTSTGDNGAYVDIVTAVGKDYFVSVQITNGAATATAGARIATSGWAPIATSADVPAGQTRTITFSGKATTTLTRFAFDRRASGAVSGEILTLGPVQIREILSATTYIDSTGTQPVTAIGDLVGLLTDRSYGSGNLGAEFYGTEITLAPETENVSIVSTVGKTYRIYCPRSDVGWNFGPGWITLAVGWNYIVANGTGGRYRNWNTTTPITFTPSVREVLGNHGTQPTTASKPIVTRVPKRLGPNIAIPTTATTGWGTVNASIASDGTALTVTNTSAAEGYANSSPPLLANKTYWVTLVVNSAISGGAITLAGTRTALGGTGFKQYTVSPASDFLSNGLRVSTNSATAGHTIAFQNVTVQEVLEWSNALDFDGSNDSLSLTGPTLTSAATYIFSGTCTNLASYPVLLGQAANGLQVLLNANGSVTVSKVGAGMDLSSSAGAVAAGVPFVLSVVVAVGGTSRIFVNGAQVGSGTQLSSALAATTIFMGFNGTGGFRAGRSAFESLLPVALADADRKTVERFAANRAGVTYVG